MKYCTEEAHTLNTRAMSFYQRHGYKVAGLAGLGVREQAKLVKEMP